MLKYDIVDVGRDQALEALTPRLNGYRCSGHQLSIAARTRPRSRRGVNSPTSA